MNNFPVEKIEKTEPEKERNVLNISVGDIMHDEDGRRMVLVGIKNGKGAVEVETDEIVYLDILDLGDKGLLDKIFSIQRETSQEPLKIKYPLGSKVKIPRSDGAEGFATVIAYGKNNGEYMVEWGERDGFVNKRLREEDLDRANAPSAEDEGGYSFEDMNKEVSGLMAKAEDFWEKMYGPEAERGKFEENLQAEQLMIRGFKEGLLKRAEDFKNVYWTGAGSVYFTLKSGESFRIKSMKIEDSSAEFYFGKKRIGELLEEDPSLKNILEIQPIFKKVYFLDDEEIEKMEKYVGANKSLLGFRFTKKELGLGLCPLEIGIPGKDDFYDIEEDGDSVTIRPKEGKAPNFVDLHYGHKITKIGK